MTAIYFLLLFLYMALLVGIAFAFIGVPVEKPPVSSTDQGVSIILCMRNEEQHITACLQSIFNQHYTKELVQLIIVDDDSQDRSVTIAKQLLDESLFESIIIQNTKREGKKASISKAIGVARHPLILLRDADTLSPDKAWLNSMLSFQKKGNYDLVIGPVMLMEKKGLLAGIQQIENNILQVLSAGTAALQSPFLCSAANLLFTRTAYDSVKGFSSHQHLESGDDIFFLEDLKRSGKARIAYLKSKEAWVYTYPESGWKAVLHQKTRWAAKFRHNPNPFNTLLAALVFGVNLIWVLAFLHPLFFFHLDFFLLLFMFLKSGTDIFLLLLSRSFMPIPLSVPDLFFGLLVYPFYALLIGSRALFSKPNWT